MGFQAIHIIEAPYQGSVVYGHFDGHNQPSTVSWSANVRNSRLYASLPDKTLKDAETKKITIQNHSDGVLPDAYSKFAELADAFEILGTAFDKKGQRFVTTVEHKNYPIYAVQFHPEKTSYVWNPEIDAPHVSEARDLLQHYANFIVDESRQNSHSMEWDVLKGKMFANEKLEMTDGGAQDVYIFEFN